MPSVLESLASFLAVRAHNHLGADLMARWTPAMETQVNVSAAGGEPVEGSRSTWTDGNTKWWNVRVPKKANSEPEFKDYELYWSLDEHAEAIGSTGWDWQAKRSRWFGFDFDAIAGHAKGIAPEKMEAVKDAATAVPWVEVRKSTSGSGLHLYVYLDDEGVETANHTEHAMLGKAILSKLSTEAGFDFNEHVDVSGGNMWIWHRKMTAANEGLKLVKPAERALTADEVPTDWRDAKPQAPADPVVEAGDTRAVALAMAVMLALKVRDNGDGSSRLFTYACRGVEHGLSDEQIIAAIRGCEAVAPLPREYSDPEIVKRIRDAEKKAERGSALSTKPEIDITQNDLQKLTKDVWDRIAECNNPPTLYRYGGVPVRVERDDSDEPVIRGIGPDELRYHLATWVRFSRTTAKGVIAGPPPLDLVRNVLATPEKPLPILDRVTETPVFAEDGELQTTPGYHAASRTLFYPQAGFGVPTVSRAPTKDEVDKARELITTDLIGDFPFTNESEKAHAIALFLLPFARSLIKGATPLHLFEKPIAGTGATLLVEVLTGVAIGRPVSTMTEGRDEEEWRKRITAKLRSSPTFVLIDNLRETLDSAAVASAITSPTWEDRVLGESKMVRLPVRSVWIATGNNPRLSAEITRRTVRVRLNAQQDRPWLRDGFRHDDLKGWASENRGQLVCAALTLIQAWLAAGRPLGTRVLGMFESWSRVVGGILEEAKIPGFLANLDEFYDTSDAEGAAWRGLLSGWWAEHGSDAVQAKAVLDIAQKDEGLNLGTGGDQSQRVKLGKLLAGMRDRVFDIPVPDGQTVALRIENAGKRSNATLWRLQPAADGVLAA